jgi:GTPase SAR1 family protein
VRKKGTVADLCNFKITTHSVKETKKLGEKIGACLQAKIVLALIGDLGSGKTSFVQGLARGLEVPNDYYITSPSYRADTPFFILTFTALKIPSILKISVSMIYLAITMLWLSNGQAKSSRNFYLTM